MSENALTVYAEAPADELHLERCAAEIRVLTQQTTAGIIRIGELLIEAKASVKHGMWGDWLERQVSYSQTTANRFMATAERFADQPKVHALPISKVYALLTAPDEAVGALAERAESLTVSQLKEQIAELKKELDCELMESGQLLAETERKNSALKEQMEDAAIRMNELQMQVIAKDNEAAQLKQDADAAAQREQMAVRKLAKAEAALETIKRDKAKGARQGAASAPEIDQARAQAEAARAELQAAREQLTALKARMALPANPASVTMIPASALARATQAFLASTGALPYMGATLSTLPETMRERYKDSLDTLSVWLNASRAAMDGIDIEIREGEDA